MREAVFVVNRYFGHGAHVRGRRQRGDWHRAFSNVKGKELLKKLATYRHPDYNRNTYMPDVLKATEFHLLLALSQGPRHGYALMKEVEQQSNGGVRLEIGSLYRLLSRMLDSGFIEEADEDERRRYYRISRVGRRVLKAEAERLADLVALSRERKLLPEGRA
jgi:DNA-binding PadR family transcriptional regulator